MEQPLESRTKTRGAPTSAVEDGRPLARPESEGTVHPAPSQEVLRAVRREEHKGMVLLAGLFGAVCMAFLAIVVGLYYAQSSDVNATLPPMVNTAQAAGFGADSPPTRIPVPAQVFSATVEDQSGTQIEVTRTSFNGEVYFYGNLGEAQVTVPFEKVREVRFEPSEDAGKRVAFLTLHDGSNARILVEDDTPCYGETVFGNYKITVEHIRRITMAPRAATPADAP